jgi:low temperature requirement protein LtrA
MTTKQNDNRMRVTNAELFFDLVFVFTISQITHLIDHADGLRNIADAFIVLVIIWYIYSGYIWLINSAGKRRIIYPVLLLAMSAFFLIAISIPDLFADRDSVFGLAYGCAVFIHLVGFSLVYRGNGRAAIFKLWLVNGLMALTAVATSFVSSEWRSSFLFFCGKHATLGKNFAVSRQ